MEYSNTSAATWLSNKLLEHDKVSGVKQDCQNLSVSRKGLSTAIIVVFAEPNQLKVDDVKKAINGHGKVNFVVNIKKEGYLLGDLILFASKNGFSIGNLSDLNRALYLDNVSNYVSKTIVFIERGLRQHKAIQGFQRESDLSYLIFRKNHLPDITAVFLHEYELTAEHIRVARDRYGVFNMLVNTDPNGNLTQSAYLVAKELNVDIYKWGEFYGALNK
jgi:hypothetical protein